MRALLTDSLPMRERAAPAPQARPSGTAAPAASGPVGYVQVASFGRPGNAAATAARLAAMGLPVRRQETAGRLHLVQIGPLSGAPLHAALATARAAGFHDAYLIR